MNKSACIFCASSTKTPSVYLNAAQQLTNILVENDYGIRYGGGSVGLMGVVADTALAKGGKITGVIPRFMVEVEWQHPNVSNMLVVETMAERKQLLIKDADVIIILPGSTGTLEELSEVLSLKKLNQISTPIIFVNTNRFFDPLFDMFQKMVDEQFMHHSYLNMYLVIDEPFQIIEAIALASNTARNSLKKTI